MLSALYKQMKPDNKIPRLYDSIRYLIDRDKTAELESLLSKNASLLESKKSKKYAATLLHKAASEGNVNIIPVLFRIAGADTKDEEGKTALHRAAQEMQGEIVSVLLKYGADTDSTDSKGQTPLHLAARAGYEGYDKIAAQLLDENASINILDAKGNTPLHLAAFKDLFRGRFEMQNPLRSAEPVITLLLSRGADVNIKNRDGKTPLDLVEPNSKEAQLLSQSSGAPSYKR